ERRRGEPLPRQPRRHRKVDPEGRDPRPPRAGGPDREGRAGPGHREARRAAPEGPGGAGSADRPAPVDPPVRRGRRMEGQPRGGFAVKRALLYGAARVLIGGGLGVWRYELAPPPPPPPPTQAEIDILSARRDALQARIRELVVAAGEKGLARAPKAGVMIGVPTSLTQAIAERVVAGFFSEMTLTLRNIKGRKAGDVKVKMLLGKRRIGAYDPDVNIAEIAGVLKPGKPVFRFSAGRFAFVLPVSVAEGQGRAQLHFKWDSKGLAANVVCGDA